MLPYFRTYAFVAYIVGVAAPVLLITGLSWILGFYVVSTLPGLISAILLMIISLLTAKKIVTGMADRKTSEMLSLYNDKCDPQAFVDASQTVVREMRPPYDETASWYLSFYALALDDLDKREEAVRIGQAMLSSAQMAQDPKVKAALLVNIEPLVQRLFGVQQALDVVVQGQEVLAGSTDPDDLNRVSFLTLEREVSSSVDVDECVLVRVVEEAESLVSRRVEVAALRQGDILICILDLQAAVDDIKEGLNAAAAERLVLAARMNRRNVICERSAHLRRTEDRRVAVLISRNRILDDAVRLKDNEVLLLVDRSGRKKGFSKSRNVVQITH